MAATTVIPNLPHSWRRVDMLLAIVAAVLALCGVSYVRPLQGSWYSSPGTYRYVELWNGRVAYVCFRNTSEPGPSPVGITPGDAADGMVPGATIRFVREVESLIENIRHNTQLRSIRKCVVCARRDEVVWASVRQTAYGLSVVNLAAALFVPALFISVRARVLRRRILSRRTRGLCLNCGYDLRGAIAVRCPECGRATEPGKGGWRDEAGS